MAWKGAGKRRLLLVCLLELILAFSLLLSVSISLFKPAQAQEEECLKIYYDSEKGYYYFWTLNREKVVLEMSGFAVLNRWDGEAWISFGSFPSEGEVEIEVEVELAENKLKWKGKWKIGEEELEVEVELEPKNISEYGDLEWSMKLTDKPPINVFTMPIQSENLKFFYQPPLYEEYGFSEPFSNSTFFVNATHVMEFNGTDWITTTYRPENVVGSYAVYHAYKMHNEYKTGKAFHIYRPKIIDAEGNEAWCNLNISNRLLKIEIPQEFLDKAVYPVTIDPTFGYESIPSTSYFIENKIAGSWFTCPESGTADSITVYAGAGGASYFPVHLKCGIYKKSDNSFVGGTEEQYYEDRNSGFYYEDWYTFNFQSPKPSLENIDYYLVLWTDNSVEFPYDTETGKGADDYETYGTWPDPWSPVSRDRKFGIYCTYTVEAPPAGEWHSLAYDFTLYIMKWNSITFPFNLLTFAWHQLAFPFNLSGMQWHSLTFPFQLIAMQWNKLLYDFAAQTRQWNTLGYPFTLLKWGEWHSLAYLFNLIVLQWHHTIYPFTLNTMQWNILNYTFQAMTKMWHTLTFPFTLLPWQMWHSLNYRFTLWLEEAPINLGLIALCIAMLAFVLSTSMIATKRD